MEIRVCTLCSGYDSQMMAMKRLGMSQSMVLTATNALKIEYLTNRLTSKQQSSQNSHLAQPTI